MAGRVPHGLHGAVELREGVQAGVELPAGLEAAVVVGRDGIEAGVAPEGADAAVRVHDEVWDDDRGIEDTPCILNHATSGIAGVSKVKEEKDKAELDKHWKTAQRMIRSYLVKNQEVTGSVVTLRDWPDVDFVLDLTKTELIWSIGGGDVRTVSWDDVVAVAKGVVEGHDIDVEGVFQSLVTATQSAQAPGGSPVLAPSGFYTSPRSSSILEGAQQNVPEKISEFMQQLARDTNNVDAFLARLRKAGEAFDEAEVRAQLERVDRTLNAVMRSLEEEVEDLRRQHAAIGAAANEGATAIRQAIERRQSRMTSLGQQRTGLYLAQYMRTVLPLDRSEGASDPRVQQKDYARVMQERMVGLLESLGMPKASVSWLPFNSGDSYESYIKHISAYFTALTLTGPGFPPGAAAARSRVIDFFRSQQIHKDIPGSLEFGLLRLMDGMEGLPPEGAGDDAQARADAAARATQLRALGPTTRYLQMAMPEFTSDGLGASLERVQGLIEHGEHDFDREALFLKHVGSLRGTYGMEAADDGARGTSEEHVEAMVEKAERSAAEASSNVDLHIRELENWQWRAQDATTQIGLGRVLDQARNHQREIETAYRKIAEIRAILAGPVGVAGRPIPRVALKVIQDQLKKTHGLNASVQTLVQGAEPRYRPRLAAWDSSTGTPQSTPPGSPRLRRGPFGGLHTPRATPGSTPRGSAFTAGASRGWHRHRPPSVDVGRRDDNWGAMRLDHGSPLPGRRGGAAAAAPPPVLGARYAWPPSGVVELPDTPPARPPVTRFGETHPDVAFALDDSDSD